MGIDVAPSQVKKAARLARILFKHGRAELVERAGLSERLESEEGDESDESSGRPEELADDLEGLGPTYVKLGQLLSTRSDLLPAEYRRALERLQEHVEPFGFDRVRAIVEEELGVRCSKAFEELDAVPLAVGSLGQVHRAVLRGGGEVAVKVQRPGVRAVVLEDLAFLERIAELLDAHSEMGRAYDFRGILEHLRRSLTRELDYRLEARSMRELGSNLAEFELVTVPRPIGDYTTSRVLTMELVHGQSVASLGPLRVMDVEGEALTEELFRAYLHQVLVDGFFHADPHPGNVFLTDDGRLALIDVGMVARLSPRLQESVMRFLVAVSEGEGDEAAEVAIHIGRRLRTFDAGATRQRIASIVAWQRDDAIEELELGRTVLDIVGLSRETGLRLPPDLTLLAKTLLNLDRISRVLHPRFDPNRCVQASLSELVRRRIAKALLPSTFIGAAIELKDLVTALPARVNRLLESLADDQLRIRIDAIDEDRLIGGIRRVANRITMGLILAALIVGAALIMRIDTDLTLFGYPALAIVLFLGAAGGAVALLVNIVRDKGK